MKEKQKYPRLHSILNTRKEKSMVEYLSLKTIKLKLNCLFQRKPVKPKWSWHEILNSYHVVNWCTKKRQWRIEMNENTTKQLKMNMNIWEGYNSEFKGYSDIDKIASFLNKATEELVKIYL